MIFRKNVRENIFLVGVECLLVNLSVNKSRMEKIIFILLDKLKNNKNKIIYIYNLTVKNDQKKTFFIPSFWLQYGDYYKSDGLEKYTILAKKC